MNEDPGLDWDSTDPDDPVRYFDRNGAQISMRQWADIVAMKHRVRGAHADGWSTPDEDPTRVALWGEGPPLIFETMVFGGPDDEQMERYSTEVAALAGHDQWVARQRARVNGESTGIE